MSVKPKKLEKVQPAGERYYLKGSALSRVLEEASYLARCSDDKTATRIRPREYAVNYPYMQVNRPGMTSWLVFDLDHANSLIWEEKGLPAPNMIVRNRNNGHCHLYYAIAPVCTSDNARHAPINYMKAVYQAFALVLDADLEYHSGPVAKTPGHPWWATMDLHDHVYDLGDLAEYVELETTKPWAVRRSLVEVSHSRHCLMFEQLRYYAYSIVNRQREAGCFSSFLALLRAFAHNNNGFAKWGMSTNLPESSLRATVKSVANWTWSKYYGSSRVHRGAMALDSSLPLAERQRMSAKRTHDLRHQATESKVRAACRLLQQRGQELTSVAIARMAGLARQTVAAHRHIIEEVEKFAAVIAFKGRSAVAAPDVPYGVHQVPAPPGVPLPLGDFDPGSDSS
jgi:hypothetical protein